MEWGITDGYDPYLYGEKAIAYLKKGTRSLSPFGVSESAGGVGSPLHKNKVFPEI